jgi:hypothetical protein
MPWNQQPGDPSVMSPGGSDRLVVTCATRFAGTLLSHQPSSLEVSVSQAVRARAAPCGSDRAALQSVLISREPGLPASHRHARFKRSRRPH